MMAARILCLIWFTVGVLPAAQYALPNGDASNNSVAEGAGDADGDIFDELDEGFGAGRGSGSGPDDATTYWVTTDEASDRIRSNLTTVTDPEVSTGHVIRMRTAKNVSGGRQLDATIRLYLNGILQSGASETFTDISEVWTTRAHALSAANADAISDYSVVEIHSEIIETGGGTPRIGWFSAQEFECPDAPGGGGPIFIITHNDD